MLMRGSIVLLAILAACGGNSSKPEWVGSWQTTPSPPGSYTAMTLSEAPVPGGTALTGTGTSYREAGTPTTFVVSGAPPTLTFTFVDNSTEFFAYSQADSDHLKLVSTNRTLDFTRH
jgi:hypothetical protein